MLGLAQGLRSQFWPFRERAQPAGEPITGRLLREERRVLLKAFFGRTGRGSSSRKYLLSAGGTLRSLTTAPAGPELAVIVVARRQGHESRIYAGGRLSAGRAYLEDKNAAVAEPPRTRHTPPTTAPRNNLYVNPTRRFCLG